jgi:hypothetical protein
MRIHQECERERKRKDLQKQRDVLRIGFHENERRRRV